MLPYPQDANELVSIVGIDPGSETLGCSILCFNLRTFEIISVEAVTFIGSKLTSSDWTGEIFNDRIQRIQAHERNLLQLFQRINPLIIAIESPFMSVRRPSAYGALTEVVCAVRNAVLQFDVWRPLYLVDPPNAKKAVNAKGNADKEGVKAGLKTIPELMQALQVPIEHLDEHSIDAIAVGYYFYLQFKHSSMSHF